MISLIPFIYCTGIAAAPLIFCRVNQSYKWVTKESFKKEPGIMVGLLLSFIFWPAGLLIMLYDIIHHHFPKFLPSKPEEPKTNRYDRY